MIFISSRKISCCCGNSFLAIWNFLYQQFWVKVRDAAVFPLLWGVWCGWAAMAWDSVGVFFHSWCWLLWGWGVCRGVCGVWPGIWGICFGGGQRVSGWVSRIGEVHYFNQILIMLVTFAEVFRHLAMQ